MFLWTENTLYKLRENDIKINATNYKYNQEEVERNTIKKKRVRGYVYEYEYDRLKINE